MMSLRDSREQLQPLYYNLAIMPTGAFTFAMASEPLSICSVWNESAETASVQATDPVSRPVSVRQ